MHSKLHFKNANAIVLNAIFKIHFLKNERIIIYIPANSLKNAASAQARRSQLLARGWTRSSTSYLTWGLMFSHIGYMKAKVAAILPDYPNLVASHPPGVAFHESYL